MAFLLGGVIHESRSDKLPLNARIHVPLIGIQVMLPEEFLPKGLLPAMEVLPFLMKCVWQALWDKILNNVSDAGKPLIQKPKSVTSVVPAKLHALQEHLLRDLLPLNALDPPKVHVGAKELLQKSSISARIVGEKCAEDISFVPNAGPVWIKKTFISFQSFFHNYYKNWHRILVSPRSLHKISALIQKERSHISDNI